MPPYLCFRVRKVLLLLHLILTTNAPLGLSQIKSLLVVTYEAQLIHSVLSLCTSHHLPAQVEWQGKERLTASSTLLAMGLGQDSGTLFFIGYELEQVSCLLSFPHYMSKNE
jgi:hypothetical protein